MRAFVCLAASILLACPAASESGAGETSSSSGSIADTGESTAAAIATTAADTDTGAASDGAASTGEPPPPDPPSMLPTPTGTCPELADGDVTFAPAGIAPRDVKLYMSDAAAEMDGPLVFYWHGTGGHPSEATYALGPDLIQQVVAQGGIVAAPYHDDTAGEFPWFLVLGEQQDDLLVADEVLGCAIEQLGVDTTHIHVNGMSAGGLMTSQMSIRRSGYVASAAPYSGGLIADTPPDQDPSNPLSAMIFHGGVDDVVLISFQQASERYQAAIEARGGFAFICDHGMGHEIPGGNAPASVWQFFYDHPFGTTPSPYADGLPEGFPDYCAL